MRNRLFTQSVNNLRALEIPVGLEPDRRKVLGMALGRAFRLLRFDPAARMILGLVATRVLSVTVRRSLAPRP